MKMSLELRQSQRLSLQQRQGLRTLLELQQSLVHPEFPEAKRGLDGLKTAHQILQKRKLTGILIGGCAGAMWSRRKGDILESHKDVDVMVGDSRAANYPSGFEGGVDWWIPKSGRIEIQRSDDTTSNFNQTWWENGMGTALSFGIKQRGDLEYGLYIPDILWVKDMKVAETLANVDRERVTVDQDVISAFEEKFSEKKRQFANPPEGVSDAFRGFILRQNSLEEYRGGYYIEKFDLPMIVGINRVRNAISNP